MVPCLHTTSDSEACSCLDQDWTDAEVEAASFADARLHRRCAGLLRQLAAGVGSSILQACGGWAGAKAVYRFLASEQVDEADILGGHFAATRERVRARSGMVLLLHTSLAVTEEGVPLGVTAVKVWTRAKFRGTAALKRVVNHTRVPIQGKESVRWLDNLRQSMDLLGEPERFVHVADRESDIYELFGLVLELGTHCVIRTCNDRLAGDGTHTVASEMA